MPKRLINSLFVSALLSILLITVFNFAAVSSWSNGGFSADPNNPDYGTHDWIAQHALDWLPLKEKWFILKNLADYLYGTELADMGGVQDGIGDRVNHHVYYYANGSLQDDVGAERAQTEYDEAVNIFKTGNLTKTSRWLGIVAHYISDLAVFGHVMGNKTVWGDADRHDDYENYVNPKTNNYTDYFSSYLYFDGTLSHISPYNASVELAHDTTFDEDGNLTCVWMEENYDPNNPNFVNRCGESLNLAVNLLADVLHTFYLETKGLAHFIDVPFHFQETDYYCGPASLEMVFDYYGEDINQSEIADVARTFSPDGTYTDELRRAAHFSNISTSTGNELPYSIVGYTLRKLGYASFESFSMNLTQLKSCVDLDKPLILLMWYSEAHASGHFRVVTGYNETHVFLHDPWGGGGKYGGPNVAFSNALFSDLWGYSGNWALYVSPWIMNISVPTYFVPETQFTINVTIGYPEQPPNSINAYSALFSNVTVILPANVTLVEGETLKKTLGTGVLEAGANSTVSWTLLANVSGVYTITIEAEGLVSGSVWSHDGYPPYDYGDRIGVRANFTVEADSDAPVIDIPLREPQGNVSSYQEVEVFVNITDSKSGVKNATLSYNFNNSETWTAKPMSYNPESRLYNATIPGQPEGTYVKFKIEAYDYLGNNASKDGPELYFTYLIIPEFPSNLILPMLIILTIFVVLCVKKTKRLTVSSTKIQSK